MTAALLDLLTRELDPVTLDALLTVLDRLGLLPEDETDPDTRVWPEPARLAA